MIGQDRGMTGHDEATTGPDAGFAERLLEVIDSGRRTATYKLALLLALVDLCARRSDHEGRAPSELHTRDIAEQVAELYWPQVAPFRLHGSPEALDLRQISNKRSTVIDALRSFRLESESSGTTSLWLAHQRFPASYDGVITRIERTLAEQPLPRLQTVGSSEMDFPFLYDIGWGPNESFPVARLRDSGARGPAIRLFPGAGDQLVRLSPLIRPLVELHWTRMVAQLSNVATVEETLRHHLFGFPRSPFPKKLRDGLAGLQAGSCFYCGHQLVGRTQVDHFIPRVRCGIDAIENLVLADRPCNGDKSDLLAAPSLVSRWARRNVESSGTLSMIAEMSSVDSDPTGTLAVARSIYGHLPQGGTPLWQGRKHISTLEPGLALEAMAFPS